MSTFKTGGLLWHAHVSELSDNDKAAIMQIKELKDILNGQCEIIGFTLEEVKNMMCDICIDCLILTDGAFEILIYNKNCMYNFISSIPLS